MPTFTWHRPASLDEASDLARRLGPSAAFLAGGTELLPDFRRGRETARHLVALEGIPDLRGISVTGGRLRIGAYTTVAELARSGLVRRWVPALVDAARQLGSPPIRSLATVGGNFCRAVPCADLPPVALVSGAVIRLFGSGRIRELDAEAFFVGPRKTVLEPGEILVELSFPQPVPGAGASYQRFARRQGSALAVASVAARVVLDRDVVTEARIALGAVAPVPCLATRAALAILGLAPSPDAFALAAATAAEEARPIGDLRGPAEFRRELVEVLTRRALAAATTQAREGWTE